MITDITVELKDFAINKPVENYLMKLSLSLSVAGSRDTPSGEKISNSSPAGSRLIKALYR